MDAVYDKYYSDIYSYALSKTRNKMDAEDLTNSIFVAIFEYFSKDIDIAKIENLVWKIAHNVWCTRAKKYIKEKNNVMYQEMYETNYNDMSLDKIIYKEIIDNIKNINFTDKEELSFKLYYIDGLSLKEISKKMLTSESNIKYYLYSARKKVREKYNG